jgi:hypothetical protein
LLSTPAAGDGISVSTLSVDTSRSGSSTSTWSPSCLSQRVTVPSVTLSPRAGMVTGVPSPPPAEPPPAEPPSPPAWAGAGSSAAAGSSLGACSSAAGSSAAGCSAAGCSAAGAAPSPEASPPITASSAPTSTVSSSPTRILLSTPAAGDGISVSTLSVDTSRSGSSTST